MENLIESYLNGELQSTEREQFEKELIINEDLRQEVEHQRKLMEAFEHIRIKKSVQEAMHKTEKLAMKRRLLIAAMAFFLVGIILIVPIWFSRRNSAGQSSTIDKQIIDSNHIQNQEIIPEIDSTSLLQQPPKGEDSKGLPQNRQMALDPDGANLTQQNSQSVVRGDATDTSIDDAALKDFDSFISQFPPVYPATGSFKKEAAAVKNCPSCVATLQLLSKREAAAAQNDTLQYLEALSLLHRHQPQAAAAKFYALNRAESPFREEAQWLLGLTYFLQGKESAQKTLQMIAKDKAHSRREAAAAVLEKM